MNVLRNASLFALLSLALTSLPAQTPATRERATLSPDPPMTCSSCAEWNRPRPPFKVFGNTYYVGSLGLSSLLIATGEGLVLIDVALPQSAPLIDANIESLGFLLSDKKAGPFKLEVERIKVSGAGK